MEDFARKQYVSKIFKAKKVLEMNSWSDSGLFPRKYNIL